MKKTLVMLLTLIMVLSLCACGSSGGGRKVPDAYIIERLENHHGIDLSDVEFTAKHDYDAKAHIDTVLVTLTHEGYYGSRTLQRELKFQYDKSSDLWTLFAEEYRTIDWKYKFNNNILGEWNFQEEDWPDDDIWINITEVDSANITAEWSIAAYRYKSGKPEPLILEDTGTYEFNGEAGKLLIEIDLPTGYVMAGNWWEHDYITLNVSIDVDHGVTKAWFREGWINKYPDDL